MPKTIHGTAILVTVLFCATLLIEALIRLH